ncbi:MAG: hypothetical protein RO257_16630 [Candidatus Kapabacteria bacterium]|jgi:hypothetical protein|nr:hypothetical protein [Candidatus Kapabacteria bacterium]
MKILILSVLIAVMSGQVFSQSLFEKSAQKKSMIGKITYEAMDGSQVVIDRNDNTVEGDADKTDLINSIKAFQHRVRNYNKFIYHSLDNKTYETTDMKKWSYGEAGSELQESNGKKDKNARYNLDINIFPTLTDDNVRIIVNPEHTGSLSIVVNNLLGNNETVIYRGKVEVNEYEFNFSLKELKMNRGLVVIRFVYFGQIILKKVILN